MQQHLSINITMASKFCFVLLASSLALLLVADASILRTTVAEIEEDVNPSRGSCSMPLTPCLQWMKHTGSWDDEMLNPGMGGEYKNQCCGMMSSLRDKECMCSALKNTYRGQCGSGSQSFQGSGICGERMSEKLMNVPKMCGFTKEKCNFSFLLV